MFLRRLFYDATTGDILNSYMMQGALRPLTPEAEAERFGYTNWKVLEWTTPDEAIEKNFDESCGRVTVNPKTGELTFDLTPIEETETEAEDMQAALNLLGVEVTNG